MILTEPMPAVHPGMGAVVHPKGVFFRVWAPNARQVLVTGSFCDWSEHGIALHPEDEGYWAGNAPKAKPGDEYKFIVVTAQGSFYRNDPYSRQVTHSNGNSVVTDPGDFDWGKDEFHPAPWNELVIYEIHVGTFNAASHDQAGNFDSVIEKLPQLKTLGINCIQLMPVAEFPGGKSWGYNPAHPFAIETEYGGPNGLRRLVQAAHRHGIGVLMDVVYNHFGNADLDLWRFDGWYENDLGGIYFYNDWRSETPWGHTRPDYGRPQVRQYLRDNALMWLEEFRLDGLRFDATSYIRNAHGNDDANGEIPEGWSLLQFITTEISAGFPGKLLIAEDLHSNAWLTKPVAEGGAGFGAQWCPEFVHPVREALIAPEDDQRNLENIAAALTKTYGVDVFQRVVYTESHDETANGKARLSHEIAPGNPDDYFAKKRSVLAGVLTLTAPGIPLLFQGQPLNETGWFDSDKPVDWSKIQTFAGIHQLYGDLIALRTNQHQHTRGLTGQSMLVSHLNNMDKVMVFQRWEQGGPGDHTLVVLNLSHNARENYRIGVPAAGIWQPRFNSDWKGYDGDFNDAKAFPAEARPGEYDGQAWYLDLNIGPYSALILSQDLPDKT